MFSFDTSFVTSTAGAQRVLLVEDDINLRFLLKDFLTHVGYITLDLADGLNFVPTVAEFQPQVVLLDIKLPHVDGLTLLQQLRDSNWRDIPVIIWSACTLPHYEEGACHLGVQDYLIKPMDPYHLVGAIQSALSRQTRSISSAA
jgi:two-component system cell cycle response regulator DivK